MAIRRAVDAGLLGEVFNVETFVGGYAHPCRTWHSDTAVSGGAGYDWGSHHVDWVLQLLGAAPRQVQAQRAQARLARRDEPRPDPRAHDVARRARGRVPPERHRGGAAAEVLRAGHRGHARRLLPHDHARADRARARLRRHPAPPCRGARRARARPLRERLRRSARRGCRRRWSSPSRSTGTSPTTCTSASRSPSRRPRCGRSSPCSRRRSARARGAACPSSSTATGGLTLPAPVGWGVIGATSLRGAARPCCRRSPRAPGRAWSRSRASSAAAAVADALRRGARPPTPTRPCWTIPRSRRSTCRCRTACIASGRSAPPRRASTCSARSRSRPAWPTRRRWPRPARRRASSCSRPT